MFFWAMEPWPVFQNLHPDVSASAVQAILRKLQKTEHTLALKMVFTVDAETGRSSYKTDYASIA